MRAAVDSASGLGFSLMKCNLKAPSGPRVQGLGVGFRLGHYLRSKAASQARERIVTLLRLDKDGIHARPRALHPPEALSVIDHGRHHAWVAEQHLRRIHICTHTETHKRARAHTHTHTRMHTHTHTTHTDVSHTHTSVCMYIRCLYVCMYVYTMLVCMYVCMHACMHVCMHACRYVCMYVFMYVYITSYLVNQYTLHIYNSGLRGVSRRARPGLFFCFPIEHSTHTQLFWVVVDFKFFIQSQSPFARLHLRTKTNFFDYRAESCEIQYLNPDNFEILRQRPTSLHGHEDIRPCATHRPQAKANSIL